MKKNLTPEQIQARDAKRAAFRALSRKIAAMTPEARASLAARRPGIATVEGHELSAFNACLVIMQSNGTATLVGGFRQWIAHGRAVCKGQHGFSIWVPCGAKKSDAPAESEGEGDAGRTGFICGTVFDVSQTQEIAAGDGEAIELAPEQAKLTACAA